MSFLLNPRCYDKPHPDEKSRQIMLKTIEFFEEKGLARLRNEDHVNLFYEDFLQFWKKHQILATLLTPSGYGDPDSRFDLSRVCEYNEILGFYSPAYQYAYQVSILGIGPLWMSDNEAAKQRTARLLKEGSVFAFGLSERTHGADIYANEMRLTPQADGSYRANGNKYYIGNANKARIVSTMGRMSDSGDFVFFAVDSQHRNYKLIKQIVVNGGKQAFVGEYELIEYPIDQEDILSTGTRAWDACLSSINIGKFQLGFSSIGVATHVIYEALDHAYNRILYGKRVTDFPHIRKSFIEAYCRTLAMKMYALRSLDYFRISSREDRRYLLFNPIQKYKVTSQGEKVVALLQNVIAAKSFEQDTYFSSALVEIGMLPRLEGTTHVNLMQIIKFMKNYLFAPAEMPEVVRITEARDDSNVFTQYAGKLSNVVFHDYRKAFEGWEHLPNVKLFREKLEIFREMLIEAAPDEAQARNIDFMLNYGEMFSLFVYGGLVLEDTRFDPQPEAIIDRIFALLVRDLAEFALAQICNFVLSPTQETYMNHLMRKPVIDPEQDNRIWQDYLLPLVGSYTMNP